MCGIVGMVHRDGRPAEVAVLRAMADAIIHRGPDGDGYFADGPVGLGHRRLAIIDVAGSPQPMASDDGRYVIVFNGEILNYQELRTRFALPCRTNGDTEVLLRLLVTKGPAALAEIRGQFAFALYDNVEGTVLLARDRMGILPLFYAEARLGIVFASEVKALRPALGTLSLDETSLADYLLQRAVPAPHTLYEGVRKLRPGCWIRIERDGRLSHGTYWSLTEGRSSINLEPAAAVDRLEQLMELAVSESLVADVPVGAYLSGGVDSSLTVALAVKAAKAERLKTFAAGFANSADDERGFARQVSDRLGTDHHEVEVDPTSFFEDIQRLTWYRDLPISESSDVAVAALARLASEHVKVVISGEGSDELFGGYPKYKLASATRYAGAVPPILRRPLLNLGRRTVGARNDRLATALRAMEGRTEWDRIRGWFSPYSSAEVSALTGRTGRTSAPFVELRGDPIHRFGLVDLASWLPDNLLERGDRMTMASSIELRPPFLDARVVEFALALPSEMKVSKGVTKWIVKEVARRHVDANLIDRPKIGFRVPLDDWFRGTLAEPLRDLLCGSDSHVSTWLDAQAVRTMVDDHIAGRRQGAKQLWPLFSLELWARALLAPAAEPVR